MARRSCFFAAALSIGDLARGFNFVAPSTGVRVSSELGNKRWVMPPSAPRRSRLNVPLQAVAQDATSRTAPILVTGNNVEVTEPLKEYIEKKMTSVLDKVGSSVSKVDVHLTVNKNPRVSENHNTEVTVFAKHHVIRATDTSDNMYACVDLVADRIRRKLRRFKERKVSETRHRPGVGDLSEQVVAADLDSAAAATDTEEDPFEDKYGEPEVVVDMSLVKSKAFPMPPINVDEAVMCLDYIDHDFYVFRNAETNEVNVVYKRNSGGVGLIQPDAKK